MDAQALARFDKDVFRIRDFGETYAKQDFARLEKSGAILRVAHGHYMLVPERHRKPDPDWRPSLERIGLGITTAQYGSDEVAIIGPSAARVHGAVPRALGIATVSTPSTMPRDVTTVMGTVRLYPRTIDKMDVIRIDNDLATGLVTSIEMTMLDLMAKAPKWPLLESDKLEAVRWLADRADWDIAEEVARDFRRKAAFERLLTFMKQPTS